MNKCIFLDRDGVINRDRKNYVYEPEHLEILPGVTEALRSLKKAGYLLVVVTNQSGISQGLYTEAHVHHCHHLIQEACGNLIDHFYFAPGHWKMSDSLSRKPDSLMFERGIAKFNIDPHLSWMVGDKDRDLVPARKLGIKTIQVIDRDSKNADYYAADLPEALEIIFG